MASLLGLAAAGILDTQPAADDVITRLAMLGGSRGWPVRFPSLPMELPATGPTKVPTARRSRLLTAAAAVAARAADAPRPANLHALAIAQLMLGKLDEAVATLERVEPRSAATTTLIGDLAAGRIAKGVLSDQPREVARGLELLLSRRTVAGADAFNRALALEALGLHDEAVTAWTAYELADRSTSWALQAAAHRARLDAPVPASSETVEREVLIGQLAAWAADGTRADDPRLARAAALAAEHKSAHQDGLLAAAAAAASHASDARRSDLGAALRILATARDAYERRDLTRCAASARAAVELLSSAHSPLAPLAALTGGGCAYLAGAPAESAGWAADARRLAQAADPPSPLLLGQAAWLEGLVAYAQGRPAEAVAHYGRAIDELARARDGQRAASVHGLLGGVYAYLGRADEAWREAAAANRTVGLAPARRYVTLQTMALLADEAGLPRVGHVVSRAMTRTAEQLAQATYRADALAFQARMAERLGRHEDALTYWRQSLALTESIPDPHSRARTAAYIRVELAAALLPQGAAELAPLLASAEPIAGRDGELFLALTATRAQARRLVGDVAGAEAELRRAVARARVDRISLQSVAARDEAFARRVAVHEALVQSLAERGQASEALAVIEAWRAESFAPIAASAPPRLTAVSLLGVADGVEIVSLLCLERELLVWRIRDGAVELARFAVPREQVASLARRFEKGLRYDEDTRRAGEAISGWLFGERAPLPLRVVVVPDATLFAVPFAALPAPASGEPLLAAHEVTVAPSLHQWLETHHSPPFSRPCVLLVAGTSQAGSLYPQLSPLRRLDEEIGKVAANYTCASSATSRAEVARQLARGYDVVHYAGHALVGGGAGGILLLQEGGNVEAVTTEQIAHWDLRGSLVVLSSCAATDGRASLTTGRDGLARGFLTAGARGVIGTVWPLGDDEAVDFVSRLHRGLAAGLEPAAAVRQVQLALLRAERPAREWAGWRIVGG